MIDSFYDILLINNTFISFYVFFNYFFKAFDLK